MVNTALRQNTQQIVAASNALRADKLTLPRHTGAGRRLDRGGGDDGKNL